ncbi:SHSP domain-containing protein [Trichostrongylus colubriformis]|uniref:SHSP domain-containing protein n=1 Tax=Trichostrongylus colubriformis TaxID=6319 RepID=A0AAN8G317_TRICO
MRDLDRLERSIFPYWRDADHSVLHVANETQQLVDDDKKFTVSLDVSQFRPEELNVHVEGRELTIEGKQEQKNDHTSIHRSFTRKWLLPENVDLQADSMVKEVKRRLKVYNVLQKRKSPLFQPLLFGGTPRRRNLAEMAVAPRPIWPNPARKGRSGVSSLTRHATTVGSPRVGTVIRRRPDAILRSHSLQ